MWPEAPRRGRKALPGRRGHRKEKFLAENFPRKPKILFLGEVPIFFLSPKVFGLLNPRPDQIGAAKYHATLLAPNTKSYSYSISHLSESHHNSIKSYGDSGGHVKQTVRCCKKSYLYALLYLVFTTRLFENNLDYFPHKLRIFSKFHSKAKQKIR